MTELSSSIADVIAEEFTQMRTEMMAGLQQMQDDMLRSMREEHERELQEINDFCTRSLDEDDRSWKNTMVNHTFRNQQPTGAETSTEPTGAETTGALELPQQTTIDETPHSCFSTKKDNAPAQRTLTLIRRPLPSCYYLPRHFATSHKHSPASCLHFPCKHAHD